MSTTYSASLYEKTTKTKRQVQLSLEPGVLLIQDGEKAIQWLQPDIESARLADDGSVILQSGNWFLDIQDPEFAAAMERHFGNKKLFRRSFFDKIGVGGCLVAILLVVLPLLAVWFWLIPFVANQAAKKISVETEREIGDSWYNSMLANLKVDSSKTRLVQQFYDSLHFGGAYPIQVTVVEEPMVNAFAMPGGHIVVFDSIIGLMDAPEQLAGLLAHEASHIQMKHSTRAVFRELANLLFIDLLFGNYGSVSSIVAQHGGQLAQLSYSRSLELEADAHGLQLLQRGRLPLRGMTDLFRKMDAVASGDNEMPAFLSTHPAIDERIRVAEQTISESSQALGSIPASLNSIWAQIKK